MRRPLDPRHHGLHKPQKVFSRKESVSLGDNDEVYPELIFAVWDRIVKDHTSQGHRITKKAAVSGDYYGKRLTLTYEYEWDNLNYEKELVAYDTAVAEYETALASWKVFEEERKTKLESGIPKNIDALIERAEHRLANLKAAKAGQPIPFPEG
jgi:hypothetical protein